MLWTFNICLLFVKFVFLFLGFISNCAGYGILRQWLCWKNSTWRKYYVGKHWSGKSFMSENADMERVLCRKTSLWKEFFVGKDRYGKSFMSENLDMERVLCRKTSIWIEFYVGKHWQGDTYVLERPSDCYDVLLIGRRIPTLGMFCRRKRPMDVVIIGNVQYKWWNSRHEYRNSFPSLW